MEDRFQAYLHTLFRRLGVRLSEPGLRQHYLDKITHLAIEYLFRHARTAMVDFLTSGTGLVAAEDTSIPEPLTTLLSELKRGAPVGAIEDRLRKQISAIREREEPAIAGVTFEWLISPEEAWMVFYPLLAQGTGAEVRTKASSRASRALASAKA